MKARLWTIQKLSLLTTILQRGSYQPVFAYSDYAATSKELYELYQFILNSYNRVNGTNYPGLVFTFLELGEDGNLYDCQDYDAFVRFVHRHSAQIKSLWNELASKDTIIMCIEKDIDEHYPLFIDINDFQYLMPPVINAPPYSEEYHEFLLNSIWNGRPVKSIFPSNAIQALVPDIKAEDVIGLYPMFTL
ncbi:MAG: hypothetical protein K5908_03540 [Erysipelotrichaceae bacterium]|nr:hypothetical protein [Erysipelotrichaceae bacterium]